MAVELDIFLLGVWGIPIDHKISQSRALALGLAPGYIYLLSNITAYSQEEVIQAS